MALMVKVDSNNYLRNDSKAGAGEARGIWVRVAETFEPRFSADFSGKNHPEKTRQRPLRKNIHAALRAQKVNKISQVAQFNVP